MNSNCKMLSTTILLVVGANINGEKYIRKGRAKCSTLFYELSKIYYVTLKHVFHLTTPTVSIVCNIWYIVIRYAFLLHKGRSAKNENNPREQNARAPTPPCS